jgi:hypothetical protein
MPVKPCKPLTLETIALDAERDLGGAVAVVADDGLLEQVGHGDTPHYARGRIYNFDVSAPLEGPARRPGVAAGAFFRSAAMTCRRIFGPPIS